VRGLANRAEAPRKQTGFDRRGKPYRYDTKYQPCTSSKII